MSPSPRVRSRITRSAVIGTGALASVLALTSPSQAGTICRTVSGHYQERDASGPDCTSPVGLCIAGEYRGSIRGTFSGEATSLVPTADTPTTGVVLFTSDSRIDARIGRDTGRLVIKNAGAFRTVADGSIVDVQTIVGGTGDFAGATGAIRASGTFSAGSGTSSYTGTVCRGS